MGEPGSSLLERPLEPSELPPWLTEADLDVFAESFEHSGFTGGRELAGVPHRAGMILGVREGPPRVSPEGPSTSLTCYFFCAPGRIRTCDTGFRRAVLYPLSYEGRGLWETLSENPDRRSSARAQTRWSVIVSCPPPRCSGGQRDEPTTGQGQGSGCGRARVAGAGPEGSGGMGARF